MKRLHRFYIDTPVTGAEAEVSLDEEQSLHLSRVLRLKIGDKVELFDKSGNIHHAQISVLGKNTQLKIIPQEPTTNNQQPTTNISLAVAIPKGNRMDWLVEKCAELGLNKLIPMETRRSVVRDVGENKVKRWKKIAVEAARQSSQSTVMEIAEILPFAKLLGTINDYNIKLLAYPEGDDLITYSPLISVAAAESRPNRGGGRGCVKILYLIGPEGDFSPDEVEKAKAAGFKAVQMPVGGILRVETAAVAMLAMLKYQLAISNEQ
ncbi:MAG: 16S rRNA (uracil(1498)-N(3))-methyltransferase [Planctomycetes bacterium]|nr:16S rRNA (uracil(1498)-N(3))-methyltransferase [Planctomycetota bacterium]